jgi:hypothetical protein
LFVVAWMFGPYSLRAAVPVWLAFAVALALELQFFLGWPLRSPPSRERSDRAPDAADRERWGFERDADELLLVRRDGEELWIPYSGESEEELEELIAEARAEAEQRALGPVPYPDDRRGRPLGQLLAGIAVVAALAALVWFVDSRSGWNGVDREARAEAAARFSEEASRIVGHEVTIRCDESGDFVGAVQHADGVAEVGGRLAYLTPERCYDLYRLAFGGEVVAFSQTGRSIAVLAHESWHLRGVRDEGTTECYALQSGVDLGRRLGLSERTARRMMRQQLAENRLRSGTTSEYLVPPDCREGGRLDLTPGDSEFP